MIGMFIFGGKKEKKKAKEKSGREEYERKLKELSKKYGIPIENLENIGLFVVYNGGQARILQKALGIPEKKIFDVLDARYTIPDRHIYISSHHEKKWHKRSEEPYGAHLAQIHPILAVAAAEHTKTYTREVGHAVGNALDRIYKEGIYLELKKDPTPLIDAIYEELIEMGIPIANTKKFYEDMEKAFKVASKIADKIVIMNRDPQTIETAATIMAGHVEDPVSKLKELGIDITPEIEELKQVFAEISGKKIEPKKPTFPETKKAVEEELRKAGIPEEKVQIVAPRLATAVWLDRWFENAKKSYMYKRLGGVPMGEMKNLRNMILAKKHVAEVAAKVMSKQWTRGNHTPITEGHVDPKMLPMVREHAAGMFEDLENIRKAVKEGRMSVGEALLRLHLELAVLLLALELVEGLIRKPESLTPNPYPLGPLDSYLVPLDRLGEAHRDLKLVLGLYLR